MVTKKKTAKKTVKQEVEEVKTPEVEEKKEEKKSDVIGSLKGGKEVHQAGKHLKVKSVMTPVNKRELPRHLQVWLTNKGYGTNVYLESKEWLEKHNVDMDKIEELKKFINDRYL
jgi:hypothetical protein